jgi:hypothetical protein
MQPTTTQPTTTTTTTTGGGEVVSLVIEAWITPLSAITPSLILHNLELIGIQFPQALTVTIDRGHYDCTDTNYAVIMVNATSPIRLPPYAPHSFCCSFFSHSVTRDMHPSSMYPHWLGNCYMHLGYTCGADLCSYRHEAGRAKTWNLTNMMVEPGGGDKLPPHPPRKEGGGDKPEPEPEPEPEPVSMEPVSVSVEPEPVSENTNTKTKTKTKTKLKIVQLQKKAFLLRTELDVWKAEVKDLKSELMVLKAELCAELGAVKAEQVGLAQRYKEQEAWVKRANQCMQDWTHQQVVERIRILENTALKQSKPKPYESVSPFDFKEIWDNYADMPALDLIANHYAIPDTVPAQVPVQAQVPDNSDDDDDDDDCFIQVVVEK